MLLSGCIVVVVRCYVIGYIAMQLWCFGFVLVVGVYRYHDCVFVLFVGVLCRCIPCVYCRYGVVLLLHNIMLSRLFVVLHWYDGAVFPYIISWLLSVLLLYCYC